MMDKPTKPTCLHSRRSGKFSCCCFFHYCWVTVSLLLLSPPTSFDFEWSPVKRRRCQVGTMLLDSFSYPLCFINKIGVIPRILFSFFIILLRKAKRKKKGRTLQRWMNYYSGLSEGADRAIARAGFPVRSSWTLVQKDEAFLFLPPDLGE